MNRILVAEVSEFEATGRVAVTWQDREYVVIREDGEFVGYENRCPHQGGPVGEGVIIGRVETTPEADEKGYGEKFSSTEKHLVCPWHGYEFNLKTGVCPAEPRIRLRPYEVTVDDGEVFLTLPDRVPAPPSTVGSRQGGSDDE